MKTNIKTYPFYVQLKEISPYGDRVVRNGVIITTINKTKISNKSMEKKIEKIEDYLIITY